MVTYDYLIVAAGLKLRFDLIPGAEEALIDNRCPVGSVYSFEFAKKMSQMREAFQGGRAIFTQAPQPIKCAGAPQKIMYLCEETWREKNLKDITNIHFYTAGASMFPACEKFSRSLNQIATYKGIKLHYEQELMSIDGDN